ncbi:hypothetical protein [Streptomyces meridianus]|uniref:hypothetical protein n=1 Tax=Streptomyces meridianus TaxID=2938945 RepID=UPI0027E25D72|nr:hypothetical protein [Streptomyces meridianus]
MNTAPAAITGDLAPSGVLRAAINLGNPVLTQGTPTAPAGVTVDIARQLGARLGIPVEFLCFDAARKSYEAMAAGRADVCFPPSSPHARPRSPSLPRTSSSRACSRSLADRPSPHRRTSTGPACGSA